MSPKSDIEMLEFLQSGDPKAFELFYKTHLRLLWCEAFRLLEDRQKADDAVQEVFIDFWEKKLYNRIQSNLTSYMFTCIRRRCYKLRKDIIEFEDVDKNIIKDLQSPERQFESNEISHGIEKAMATMPPQSSKVFQLYVLENKQRKEVARELGISDNTAKSYLATALKIARQKLLIFRKDTPI